jgi:predicted nucleotidyltransferase
MFKKEIEILQEISKRLAHDKKVLRITVYGSRIRGDYTGNSDMDVAVIVEKKDQEIKGKIHSLFYDYELKYDLSFSVKIFSLQEYDFNKKLGSPFMKNMKREGKIFYDSQQKRKKDTSKLSYSKSA